MRFLLVATYELGQQPLGVAGPATVLARAGHEVQCVDLSIEPWPEAAFAQADAVVFSIPMHTATELAVGAAARARAMRPEVPFAFLGLYAPVLADQQLLGGGDLLVAGDAATPLVEWAAGVGEGVADASMAGAGDGRESGTRSRPRLIVDLGPATFAPAGPPRRDLLAPLSSYVTLMRGDERKVVAGVETSRGCNHRCTHCPVAAVYHGRSRAVPLDDVLADVEQAVALGAEHLSIVDPDFLNRPRHAVEVARAVHDCWPQLTFDATVKVEHILRHAELWPELHENGCVLVVSAFESTDDRVLGVLDKGHCRADLTDAVRLLRRADIEVRPSWLPFSPWTTRESLAEVLRFTVEADLVESTDPVQFSIRLLLPAGSLLITPEITDAALASAVDAALESTVDTGLASAVDARSSLGSRPWRHADPRIDALQAVVADLVATNGATFGDVWQCFADGGVPLGQRPTVRPELAWPVELGSRPALSEAWFCCAEPTKAQLDLVHRS